MRNTEQRTCKNCGKMFAGTGKKIFCSRLCCERDKHKRRYVPKDKETDCVCSTCGSNYRGNKTSKYCSSLCKSKAIYRRTTVFQKRHEKTVCCTRCGKGIGWHGQRKFCRDCQKIVALERRRVPKKSIECQKCGKVFVGVGRRKYCDDCKTTLTANVLDYLRSFFQRSRAKEAGVPHTLTGKEWQKTLDYFGYKCAYCGASGRMTQDHFIPLSKGGGYTAGNIVPACFSCNSAKNDNDPRQWLPVEKYHHIANYLGAR